MMALLLGLLDKITPFKWYALGAAVLAVLSFMGAQAWQIRTLKMQLAQAQTVVAQVAAEGKATAASLAQAERRAHDRDLQTAWLLHQFGETLPKTDEEARQWAIRAAKEINR